ncbi:hypothetical protein ACFHW2_41005 [Actinomadura sp. LOL_016]|uniref:hypothetical protein n=1 Tax=unclassified Actinomadura TaxID=2626254 RepID=UPI003A811C4E
MKHNIRVDAQVYAWLESHAQGFSDLPNRALRRILGLDPDPHTNGSASGDQDAAAAPRAPDTPARNR